MLTDEQITKERARESRWCINSIEYQADRIREYCEFLERYMHRLEQLPEYETQAEDSMKKAEKTLSEALLAVKIWNGQLRKIRDNGKRD